MAENNDKAAKAAKIVRNHVLLALGTGLIPVVLLDLAMLSGVQFWMLKKLAALYEVEFSEQRGNSIIGSLVGVSVTATGWSLLKSIPGVGTVAGGIGGLTFMGASTYALGQVFIKHFESGGTFMTFDPARAKASYDESFEEKREEIENSYAGIKP